MHEFTINIGVGIQRKMLIVHNLALWEVQKEKGCKQIVVDTSSNEAGSGLADQVL